MDPAIIAAIIGAATTVGGSVVTYLIGNRKSAEKSRRKNKEVEEAILTIGDNEFGVLVAESAYKMKRVEKEVTFDAGGSGVQIQRWIGLEARQSFSNLEIPWNFAVEQSSGAVGETIVNETNESSCGVELKSRQKLNHFDNVNSIECRFVVNGQFSPDSEPVCFECRQEFTRAFICDREEMKEEYGDSDWLEEYTATRANVATDVIKVAINFPNTFATMKPSPTAVVFIGKSHVVHQSETSRCAGFLKFNGTRAILEVENPAIGLSYAISWSPPASEQVSGENC